MGMSSSHNLPMVVSLGESLNLSDFSKMGPPNIYGCWEVITEQSMLDALHRESVVNGSLRQINIVEHLLVFYIY